jgi:hypothetical protein
LEPYVKITEASKQREKELEEKENSFEKMYKDAVFKSYKREPVLHFTEKAVEIDRELEEIALIAEYLMSDDDSQEELVVPEDEEDNFTINFSKNPFYNKNYNKLRILLKN